MDDDLVEAVRDRDAILFVGAAVSRSLGLPSFAELIRQLAIELRYDPEVFEPLGDYRTLAEYYQLEKQGLGALRSQLDKAWHTSDIDVSSSELHRLILLLRFPVIYTTNWDAWLEKAPRSSGGYTSKDCRCGGPTWYTSRRGANRQVSRRFLER